MKNFDPNAAAPKDAGIFGLPFTEAEAQLVIIPVPWEVTTSYGGGTSHGPQAIFQASQQIDLFDKQLGNFFTAGIAMIEESVEVHRWNEKGRRAAQIVISAGGGAALNSQLTTAIQTVNQYSEQLNEYVYTQTKKYLAQGKQVGIVGGDHSTPFGAIRAFLEHYPRMGILHFDAHADMRRAFEGFEHSHASIMYNVIEKTNLTKLVQVGIRDFCEEEYQFIQQHPNRITTFFDADLTDSKMNGQTWAEICDKIVESLPHEVYVSFDIDGLDPRYCPHTGTPVPGGLDFQEALYLLKRVSDSGRKIIGFDLNEVAPSEATPSSTPNPAAEWDANVGARLLYKLCGWTLQQISNE